MTDSSKTAKKTEGIQRRFFFKKTSSALIFGGALAYGLGSSFLLEGREKRLRPPGALEEDLFLASCIKCGQCLQVCPPQVILLAGLADGNGIGTPFIVPRDGGCILCKGLPCVLACPTGALDHHISEGSEAEMGITVLSHPETCLARSGTNDIIHQMQTLLEKESSGTTSPSRKVRRQWNRVMIRLVDRLEPEESRNLAARFKVREAGLGALLEHLKGLDHDQKKLCSTLPGPQNRKGPDAASVSMNARSGNFSPSASRKKTTRQTGDTSRWSIKPVSAAGSAKNAVPPRMLRLR